MQIIAVSNRKGGVGKTTLAVNLATGLADLGLSTLLIDLDSQGHCATGLGVCVEIGQSSVHQLFREPQSLLDPAICPTKIKNLSLAPADPLFEHGSSRCDTQRLAQALKSADLASRFDAVVIDTPPSLDDLMLNALQASDWVLIPYVPHYLSLEGIRQLMRVLFRVMSRTNTKLRIMGFIPMQVVDRVRQHRLIGGEISRQFGALRVLNSIRVDIRLAEAFAAGAPVSRFAPKTRATEDFKALSMEVLQRLLEAKQ